MALLVDIADAVVTELNGASLSMPFTAARAYLPQFDLVEMVDLHVTVVPRTTTRVFVTREKTQREYVIHVGVQQKLQSLALAEPDGLMDLVEEIADLFHGNTLTDPECVCMSAETAPTYVPEHMDEMRQFTGVVALTFRLWR